MIRRRRAWLAVRARAMTMVRLAACMAAAAGAGLGAASSAQAQAVRITGTTTVRYIELRPLFRDSLPADETAGTGLLRQTPDGRIVRCIPEEAFCRDTRPGERLAAIPVIHDVEASLWGVGRGVRLFTQLRGRGAWGGGRELWPQADDAFEVLAAYAELERDRVRLRAGRQWKVSGLGFYNFDGVTVALRPASAAWLEVYVGRSLIRGLNEPRAGGALESIEAFAPSAAGLLVGVQARYRPTSRLAVSTLYQVDFRNDSGGLYSELAAADAVLRMGSASLEGSMEIDVAAGALNEARLRARAPPLGRVALHAELRRYRPYFELWTIWGAFSPVGFDEVRAGATWAVPAGRLIVRAEVNWRSYGETDADGLERHRTGGRGLAAHATWSPADAWRLDASYRVASGFGAARRDGHAGVAREFGDVGSLAVQGLAFQRLYEFRLDEGTVVGLGVEGTLRLSDRARLFAGVAGYRHADASAAPDQGIDWTQRRGNVRLQWVLGREPRVLPAAGGRP
jgi:hypothetical protein